MDDLHELLALVALGRVLRKRRRARRLEVDDAPPTEARIARDAALAAQLRSSVASPRPGASHAALAGRLRTSLARHRQTTPHDVEPGPATLAHGNMPAPSEGGPTSFDPRRWAA
jgi:hypothetical protein